MINYKYYKPVQLFSENFRTAAKAALFGQELLINDWFSGKIRA
jgi:hypothetical protein